MCDQCNAMMLQGVACHETGCPNSWKHPATDEPYPIDCVWCGRPFTPETKDDRFCDDSCAESFYG
jgi:hypothetical protein